jgi:hypothetical protein
MSPSPTRGTVRIPELGELPLTVLDRGLDRLPDVLGPRFEQHRP